MKTVPLTLLAGAMLCLAVPAVGGETDALQRIGDEASRAVAEFYEYDRQIPLDAHTVERDDEDAPRERIVFRGVQGFQVPGYLQFPRGGAQQLPCVLLLHGWSGSKAHWWREGGYIRGGNVRQKLLEAGCAVLALDAQCHGDRIAENGYALVNEFRPNEGEPRKRYFSQQEIYTQTVRDYRRALDYLKTRSEIDPERIAAFGYSMGGTQSFVLTSVDSRIKVAVACATPADRTRWSPLAPQNFIAGIGKRPFLMVMGENDPMCSRPDAEQLFKFFDSPAAELRFFPGDHKISGEFVAPSVAWLVERL